MCFGADSNPASHIYNLCDLGKVAGSSIDHGLLIRALKSGLITNPRSAN